MKSQKLGLVLDMNMAVACMMMQGCKVARPGADVPPSTVDNTVVTSVEPVSAAPAAATSTSTTTEISSIETEPAPTSVAPAPSRVTVVKPVSSVGAKPVPTVKPAAAVSAPAVPAAGAVPAVAAVAPATVYQVKSGDTLSKISKSTNVKMSAIVAANPGLNPNRIRIGQKINIPGSAPVAPAVAKAPVAPVAPAANVSAPAANAKVMPAAAVVPAPKGEAAAPVAANTAAPVKTHAAFKPYAGPTKEYKVRSGDSLGKIAYENGITIRALKELNKLSKDTVRVGQTLLVPTDPRLAAPSKRLPPTVEKPAAAVQGVDAKKTPVVADPADLTVKPAVKEATVDAVDAVKTGAAKVEKKAVEGEKKAVDAAANVEKAVADPVVDAEKKASDAADPLAGETSASASSGSSSFGTTYTAKDGDDIVSVAIAWGISPSQLMDLNDLKAGDPIKPGQVLKLPANAKQNVQ